MDTCYFFTYLNVELQQLGKAKLFATCKSFLTVTFSERMPKDLESLVCNAAAEAKLYSGLKWLLLRRE